MSTRGWLRATCRFVLALYPSTWRARYGAELEDVLEQHRVTPSTVADLAVSALHAHRHPELGPMEALPMAVRLRSCLGPLLLATVAFALAWAEVVNVRVRNPRIWMILNPDGADEAVKAVALAGAVGLLAVMAAALLFLWSARLRGGRQRRGVVAPLAITAFAFVAFVGLFAAAAAAIDSEASGALWRVAVPSWAVVAVGVARAVAHASPDPGILRPCITLVRLGVGAMAFAVVGSVCVGAALSLEAPAIGAPILPIMLMAGAVVWAAAVLRRGGNERPGSQQVA
jgi:hypothetical protein